MSRRLDLVPNVSRPTICHQSPSSSHPSLHSSTVSGTDSLLSALPPQHVRTLPAPRSTSSLPGKSSIRNLTTQLFHRELGLRPLTISRQHINSFRRNLTLDVNQNGYVVQRRLSKPEQNSLEFLRALFCSTHLQASFERLGGSHGDVLTQQVETFLKMLKEPCPDDVASSISEAGQQLRSAVRRKAAFFDHLWQLRIDRFVVRLLMYQTSSAVPDRLFVRNKALCLRLIRRLGRRTLSKFGSRLLRSLSENHSFVHYCFQLMAHPRLTEETVILLEEVFHHRRQEMPLCDLAGVLSQTLSLLHAPHLVAKIMRLLVIMCSPTKTQEADERSWPSDHVKLLEPTTTSNENQLLLLTEVPHFIPQLMEVLDAGVLGALPRSRYNVSLDEEAHWLDWLDSEDSVINKNRTGDVTFLHAAVAKVVSVVDLMESAMLLRILLLGPHSGMLRGKLLRQFGIASRLCRYMDKLLWNDTELGVQNEDDGFVENVDLRPETPLKLQIVRCISALFENCSSAEKRLFYSKPELNRLQALADFLPPEERDPFLYSVDLKHCCQGGGSGLLTRIAFALMQQPKQSSFRLWLSKCIESYLLDLPHPLADQQLLALIELPSATSEHSTCTLLEDQISQCFLNMKFTISDTIRIQRPNVRGGLCLELRIQACDTLATMIKFNVSTSCLFLTSVWDAVRKASDTSLDTSLTYSEQEKLASALMVKYFRCFKTISNVLLRAFAVTEAASLYMDELFLYSNPCFAECSDVLFPSTYNVCRGNTEVEKLPAVCNRSPDCAANNTKGKSKTRSMMSDKRELKFSSYSPGPSVIVVGKILAEMVYSLIMAVHPTINQSNVSCLNTAIVICVLKYRQHTLADFLVDVQSCCISPHCLNKFRRWLAHLLSIWLEAYMTKTPESLGNLASTWRMSVSEIRRIVNVIFDDLRTSRFPFINGKAIMDLIQRKKGGSY